VSDQTIPEAIAAIAAAKPVGDYSCVIVPDGGGVPPEVIDSQSLEGLTAALYPKLISARQGWCFIYVKGKRASLSLPTQSFYLKLDDASMVRIEDPIKGVFSGNDRFTTLSLAYNS